MERPKLTGWVGVALGLGMGVLGIYAVGASKTGADQGGAPAGEQRKAAAEAAPTGGAPAGPGRPLHPLWDYTTTDSDACETEQSLQHIGDLLWERNCLIATVPDPLDSNFGYAFDQVIEAIQEAVEAAGTDEEACGLRYVFDRYWLPWELDRQQQSAAHHANDVGEQPAPISDEFPGTLLFRGSRAAARIRGKPQERDAVLKDAVFVVFLVGETPTEGIDKRAFTKALELIRGKPPSQPGREIRVLGPYFSGSQTSLQKAVDAWLNDEGKGDSFRIISGSAIGVNKGLCFPNGAKADFHATVIPNNAMLRACLHYLGRKASSESGDDLTADDDWQNWPNARIAVLSELTTDFGQSASGLWQCAPTTDKAPAPRARLIEMHFPLHISRLKADYGKQQRAVEQQAGVDYLNRFIPRIGVGDESQADAVPSQDPVTTAATNAKVLETITTVISREQVRYVGIVATDPRDKIFLTEWIGEHCPGVQVFIVGSDDLLSLPEFAYYLKGTIIASTYPLIPANQSWADPAPAAGASWKKRLSFPCQSAEGYYNACLALMGKRSEMVEYRPPLFDKGDPNPGKPPVWITMVGQNGNFVPVQFFTNYCDEDYLYVSDPAKRDPACASQERTAKDGPPESEPETPPPVKTVELAFPATPLIGLVAICCLCGWVIFHALRSPSPLFLFWGADRPPPPVRLGDVGYRGVCLLSLSFLLVPLAVLGWIYQRTAQLQTFPNWMVWLLAWTPVLLLVGLGAALLTPAYFALWPRQTKSPAGRKLVRAGYLLYVVPALAAVVCVAMTYFQHTTVPLSSWRALFFERALDLASGVSPLLPLLFLSATYFFWSYFQLKRVFLFQRFSIKNPYPPPADYGDRHAAVPVRKIDALDGELADEVGNTLHLFRNHWPAFAFIALGAAAVAWRLWDLYLPVIEGWPWDLLFLGGFLLGFLLIVVNLARFLFIWSLVKNLLREIVAVPMARAFDRLPDAVTKAFGGYLFSQRPRFAQLLLPIHQLGLIAAASRAFGEKAAADADGLPSKAELFAVAGAAEALKEKLTKESAQAPHLGRLSDEARAMLQSFTRSCVLLLARYWPAQPVKDVFGAGGAGDSEKKAETERPRTTDEKRAAAEKEWVQALEGFVAVQAVAYISQYFIQLRNLVWSLTTTSCLLLLAATSYPFHPEHLMLYLLLGLIACVIGAIVYVLAQMNIDELLSRIAKTAPNRFTLDPGFVSSFITYVLPIVGVISLQLSGAFRFMIEPILRVLK